MYHSDSRCFIFHGNIVRKNSLFLNSLKKARSKLCYQSRFHGVMMAVLLMSMQLAHVAEEDLLAGQLLDQLLRVG